MVHVQQLCCWSAPALLLALVVCVILVLLLLGIT
jgi:hypothetical protein